MNQILDLQRIIRGLKDIEYEQKAIYKVNQRHKDDTSSTEKRIQILSAAINILQQPQCIESYDNLVREA